MRSYLYSSSFQLKSNHICNESFTECNETFIANYMYYWYNSCKKRGDFMIGQRILELRKQNGMSQEQLAEKLQVTRQTISKWESDKSIPDVTILITLSEIFGVSLDFLIAGKETVNEKSNTKKTNKHYYIAGSIFLLFGIIVLLLLPTIASLYQVHLFETYQSVYTDYKLYLQEWPLKGLVYLGRVFVLSGIVLATIPLWGNKLKNVLFDYK